MLVSVKCEDYLTDNRALLILYYFRNKAHVPPSQLPRRVCASSVVLQVSSRVSSLSCLPLSLFAFEFLSPDHRLFHRSRPFRLYHKNENFRSATRTANGDRSFKAPTEQVSEDARGSGCVMHRCARRHNVTISHVDVGEVRVKRQTRYKNWSCLYARSKSERAPAFRSARFARLCLILCIIPSYLARREHLRCSVLAGPAIKILRSNERRVWRMKFYSELFA